MVTTAGYLGLKLKVEDFLVLTLSDGRTERQTDGRMDGWMDGWMDEWTDGRTDRRTDGQTDGRMDGWMDGRTGSLIYQTLRCHHYVLSPSP